MTIAPFDGVTIEVSAAFSSAVDTYGDWDLGEWDAALWGPDETFVDISDYLRSFSTYRRFGREVQAWDGGTGTLVLDNRDGRFSMDNLSGPYVTSGVTGIRPWRPVRIKATYNSVEYWVAKLYAIDWVESYPSLAATNSGDAICTVPMVDEFAKLVNFDGLEQSPAGSGDLFGRRIHRILDAAGHTTNREVEVGTTTMQATTLAANTITELKLTADSEGGAVYVGADGAVVAEGMLALVENTRSITSQATFGDGGGGEIPYSDISIDGAGDLIVNIASYARAGSSAQTVVDNTSRALYGDRRDTRTDLICETDDQAEDLATWKVARFKDPERRVSSITIKPRRDPATLFPLALGLKVRDLITVVRRPPGGHTITQYCHIAGIRHQVTPDNWTTTFELFSATAYRAFTSSLWDTGLWGSSGADTEAARWFF
jgi:hypothetical protein